MAHERVARRYSQTEISGKVQMNKRAIIVLLLLLCFGAAAKAATDGQDSQAASRHGKPSVAAKDSDNQSDDTVEKFKPKSAETPGGEENLAPDVVKAKNDYDREYWQYRSKSLVQTERTFAWQHIVLDSHFLRGCVSGSRGRAVCVAAVSGCGFQVGVAGTGCFDERRQDYVVDPGRGDPGAVDVLLLSVSALRLPHYSG